MIREAYHRHAPFRPHAARGKCEPDRVRSLHGAIAENLVKIAHSVDDKCVRVLFCNRLIAAVAYCFSHVGCFGEFNFKVLPIHNVPRLSFQFTDVVPSAFDRLTDRPDFSVLVVLVVLVQPADNINELII